MNIHLTLSDLLLLAPVPFLLLCLLVMISGLFYGPREGAFRLFIGWAWLPILAPCLAAGLWGIARTVAS